MIQPVNPPTQLQLPAVSMLDSLRDRRRRLVVADSLGTCWSGRQLLTRIFALRSLLQRVLPASTRHVGLLLPPAGPSVVCNLALAVDQRVSVNLNYTLTGAQLAECCRTADLTHIITSRQFQEKIGIDLPVEPLFVEDLIRESKFLDKVAAAILATGSAAWIAKKLGLARASLDDALTIIFTSGSSGVPKGVILSNRSIACNVLELQRVARFRSGDRILGVLPFFHSFGYTGTLWGPATLPTSAVYHYSPLEPARIGRLLKQHNVTAVAGTPTFLRKWLEQIPSTDLASVEMAVAGGERMPADLATAYREQSGVELVEAYGITELGPLIAVDLPRCRHPDKACTPVGSVGRPANSLDLRIVCPETGRVLAAGQEGIIEVAGPHLMNGYVSRPDLTGEAITDGWFRTGDLGRLDDSGFLFVTGRRSRFSKIGGEMVPHELIERRLRELADPLPDGDSVSFVVTAVADSDRGERLIVTHTGRAENVQIWRDGLASSGLPNLFVPSRRDFIHIAEIPLLGSGKPDLVRVLQYVRQQLNQSEQIR